MEALEKIKKIYPFDTLPIEEIEEIVSIAELKTYKKNEILFKEGSEPLNFLYIILEGEVFLEKNSQLIAHLKGGDIFGYVSLVSEMSPVSTARIVEDNTKILQIKKEKFLDLLSKYESFSKYFTKELAKRVHKVPKLRSSFQMERLLDVRIKDIKIKEPLLIKGNMNIIDTAKTMAEHDSTFCLVQKDGEIGIITERDIIKKILAKEINPSLAKAQDVATFPIITMDASEPLFNALLTMAKHRIRKLVIMDSGAIWGILDDRVVISHESKNIIFLIKEIDRAKSTEELSYLYSLVNESVIDGVMSGLDPEYVGKYIAELNDHFMARVVRLVEEEIGLPLCNYSIMVIGSEGRREQSLKTDQDNALIFEGNSANREYFEKFSELYIKYLLDIGFPPCQGNVMISNPYWRRTKEEWFKEIGRWMENPKPENVLNISIFFDFRNVFGEDKLIDELWQFIFQRIRISKHFLPFLASEAIKFTPPVGFLGKLKTEKEGKYKGEIDIKKYGIFPITQGIRVLSLHNEIRNTNTFERIRKLKDLSIFTPDFARDLEEGYRFLMTLRLKSQAKKIRNNIPPDNYINPKELSKTEKEILIDVFKKIEEFQKLLFDKYNLRYFS
ncbi:putative nucleotidyltransferase substrate binding domain-containing protein [Thermodesulfovibrio yellowstonii]|uniref:Nucleotidyltransferase family protein n=1 Tax=Thermodesulfovibrio yellowstonii TaxID=28262 RepID=A0A9W6LJW3_9BACT|nr:MULTISPECIES: putative nucleotidyltransferase substrate binding domain-containing protein [Thermodesulfovibrio]MDI6865411.1 putative nucleotidyltransferase substrate binding domain-containing protein [Thermodesulfovibrio yellowstonii]GLI52563.1 nucleotidyltransferase family protein [Thermodesulfovibrio islandicus]